MRLYVFAFLYLRRLFFYLYPDDWSGWKASVVLVCLWSSSSVCCVAVAAKFLGASLPTQPPYAVIVVGVAGISWLHHRLLFGLGTLKRYEPLFVAQSQRQQVIGAWLTLFLFVAALLLHLLTFSIYASHPN